MMTAGENTNINIKNLKGYAITSRDNKKFKELKKYSLGQKLKKSEYAIVSGRKLIKDFLNDSNIDINNIILSDKYSSNDKLLNDSIIKQSNSGSIIILKNDLFNEIDIFNTQHPILTTAIPEIKKWDFITESGLNLIIPFQDPVNTGSVIRSAAGFGIKNIVILKETANPFHPKSIRTSAGAVFRVSINQGPSIHELQNIADKHSINIIALDTNGITIDLFEFPENFYLLPGIEGPGLPDILKKKSVSIKVNNTIESLNASTAVSIALYEWCRRK